MDSSNAIKEDQGDLYVVGLGASAGGLDAISKFLSNFNGVSAEFCVVIVMHLSPDYKSELTSILKKRCKWPVLTVGKNTEMEARTIYVTPQNCDLHIKGDNLILDPLPEGYSHAPSIDNFFSSLAASKKRKSIGIVLSGFGDDGAQGVSDIKGKFGFTIAQLPETAEHRDMPKSAIKTGLVDVVIPAEQMYDEIVQYITNSHTVAQSKPAKKSVDAIFELLEKRSGTDFSLYKPTTIMRRINHRMNNLQINSLVDYYAMMRKSPKELDILFETVLIGVTEFFRDKKAFDSFRKHLAQTIETKKPGDSIRIWCVGCATGEEPYSVAILLHELLGATVNQYHIQIFASDIDERALNYARKGIYRKDSLKNMEEPLVATYFTPTDASHFQLNKEIKQHVLFTRHDISNDAPFVKLDAVICRNLLIYFNNDLQKQSLQIFHYALRPKAILFLGKSESISQVSDLFKKSNSNKLFYKADATLNYELRFSRFKSQSFLAENKKNRKVKTRNISIVDAAKETLYHKYQNPFVVINDNAEIKEVHGSLRLYLEISQGTMNANIYKMVNPELVTVLKGLHAQVRKTGVQHISHVVKFNLYGADHFVRINVTPLIYTVQEAQYYLVIFEKIEPSEQVLELQKKLETSDFVDLRVKELEDELATNKEHLQIFTEELETINEELQTINEELQSANEELKYSNEELETSNEELQSANEELNTANYELRVTNEAYIEKEKELKEEKELSERNELIYKTIAENIPDGAVGILNSKFEIEYLAGQWVATNSTDLVGHYMPGVNPSKKEQKKLEKVCQAALEGKESSVQVRYDGDYFNIKAIPFSFPYSEDKKILYLAQDISNLKTNEQLLDTALQASKLVVFKYDFITDEIEPNTELSEFFEIDPDEILTNKLVESLVHPEDRATRKKALKKSAKTGLIFYEVRLNLPSGTKYVRITGKLETDENRKSLKSFATVLDITKDKELLEQVRESEQRFRLLAEAVPMTIWKTDKNKKNTYVNQYWCDYSGSTKEENLGDGYAQFMHPDDVPKVFTTFAAAFEKRESFEQEFRAKSKNGEYQWFVDVGIPLIDGNGDFQGYIGSNVNINEKKQFTEKLAQQVAERTQELEKSNEKLVQANMSLEEYAYVASHDLQEPLRKIRMFNSILLEEREDDKKVINYGSKIESLADRMTELIRGILIYGELSNTHSQRDTLDLNLIISDIKEDLEDLIKTHNVELNVGSLGKVTGSKVYIHQLLINLVRNAIKFNDKEPVITISTQVRKRATVKKSFEKATAATYTEIVVADNGIGIDEKNLKTIFKPFKRLYSKEEFPGTGIGLAICKRIVEMHDGFIEVQSTKGKGTSFIIYLPERLS